MNRFVVIDKDNFSKYEKYLVSNEKYFTPCLRTPKGEFKKIIDDSSNVSILLFNHNFVGHALGYMAKDKSFYVFSVLIVPKFRGNGYGHILFNRFLYMIRKKGYNFLSGHFNNKSIKLLPKDSSKKVKRIYNGYQFVKMRL